MTFENEISDLGATLPPNSVTYQPSGIIISVTLLVAGAMIATSAGLLYQATRRLGLSISVAVLGTGIFLVGVIPGNNETVHPLVALLTFTFGGISAIVSGSVQRGPGRHFSVFLGIVALGSMAIAIFAPGSLIVERLGAGGIERWVAYPSVLWLVVFGGHLMGAGVAGTGKSAVLVGP